MLIKYIMIRYLLYFDKCMYIDLLEKFVIYVHVHIRFHFFRKYCTLTVKVNKGNMLAVLI